MSELLELVLRSKSKMSDDTDDSDNSPVDTPKTDDSTPEGMQCGFKELWSGEEDEFGKFKWLDKFPTDLGKPAEDSETAKWALIVRHKRVHNDPTKVLQMHSVVIQSPLLKTLLGAVLKDYPGVTTTLKRLTFSGRFEPLIHRWAELKEAVATEDNASTKEHAQLLFDVLNKEFKEIIEESLDLRANKVITYDLLWTIFQPSELIYTRQDGHERIVKPLEASYGQDNNGNPVFWLTTQYVDWDGTRFGTGKVNLSIPKFSGTSPITQLRAFPFALHPNRDALHQKLLDRGSKVESLAGVHYKSYNGVGWVKGEWGQKDMINVKERIVIDTAYFNRNNPNAAVYVTAFHRSQKAGLLFGGSDMDSDADHRDSDSGDGDYGGGSFDEDPDGMPYDGHFPEDEKTNARPALTEEQKLLCSPVVRGYALASKLWLNFFVNCVDEVKFNQDAFRSLVLPPSQKELILGFTETQNESEDAFDDVIEGKGRGIILLLCGPPGVGKTLTAESVSEQMKVPLYAMSAGDLGLDSRHVERTLTNILEMCANWKAVLLIDEADVFLEQRSLHELERNKLVSVFLRVLEYYKGILFLTTNRVQTFDAAFQSRIHISLDYPELNTDSRLTIWKNFLTHGAPKADDAVTNGAVADISKANGNRTIKPDGSEINADTASGKEEAALTDAANRLSTLPTSTSDVKDGKLRRTNEHTITPAEMKKLSQINLNGRQIKNVIKTSKLLASRRKTKLGYEHIKTVLDVTQHLHNATKATEDQRAAIYH